MISRMESSLTCLQFSSWSNLVEFKLGMMYLKTKHHLSLLCPLEHIKYNRFFLIPKLYIKETSLQAGSQSSLFHLFSILLLDMSNSSNNNKKDSSNKISNATRKLKYAKKKHKYDRPKAT